MSRPTYGYGADDSRTPDGVPGRERAAGADGRTDLPDLTRGVDRDAPGGQPVGAISSQEQPTCPRHPDRVSYVRCQRCGRPTCPECQRPAAVGVLCVDCAREAGRQQRGSAPRNAMGGGVSAAPVVTYTVIGLCLAVGVLQLLLRLPAVTELLAFAPFRALGMPWTFVTSGFLHGGFLHLAFNMYALYVVGTYLERTMGHARFAGVYLLGIIAGHVAVLLLADPSGQSWYTPVVGASGGIFGLFGSMFVVNRRMGAETGQVLVLIVINLLFTFTVPNVSWQGHVGGLVLGTALTAAMFAVRPTAAPGADRAALARRSTLLHAAILAAGLGLCVLLLLVKVLLAPSGSFPLQGL